MAVTAAELEIARRLFAEGWSADDLETPLQFFTDDAVVRDLAGGADPHRGKEAIAKLWAPGVGILKTVPEELFVSDDGVAVTWMAYVHVGDQWLCGEGMSRVEFRDGLVCLEIDYWHGPQGTCDDWEAHSKARQALSREERGAMKGDGTITGTPGAPPSPA